METKVRVGVRVRPLLPNEKAVGSEMVVKYPGDKQIGACVAASIDSVRPFIKTTHPPTHPPTPLHSTPLPYTQAWASAASRTTTSLARRSRRAGCTS